MEKEIKYSDELFIEDDENIEFIENEAELNLTYNEEISITTNTPKEKEDKVESEKESEKEKEKEKEKELEKETEKNEDETKSEEIKVIDNGVVNQQTCMPYFFDILPHIFKYKNPPDYYIIPILSFFIILVLELSYCLKILNLSYYCVSYFILGFLFKIILILTFAYSFETGYEYFFDIIAIIFMIYLYLTLTFLIFNLCNKNSNNELKSNNKFLWFFSLLACIISDYRCLELFTRTKIDFIEINDENNKKNKKAEIKKEKEKNKIKNKEVYNFKNYKNSNELNNTSNENEVTDSKFKTGIHNTQIIDVKNMINKSSFDDSNALFNVNQKINNLFYIDENKKINIDNNIDNEMNIIMIKLTTKKKKKENIY